MDRIERRYQRKRGQRITSHFADYSSREITFSIPRCEIGRGCAAPCSCFKHIKFQASVTRATLGNAPFTGRRVTGAFFILSREPFTSRRRGKTAIKNKRSSALLTIMSATPPQHPATGRNPSNATCLRVEFDYTPTSERDSVCLINLCLTITRGERFK